MILCFVYTTIDGSDESCIGKISTLKDEGSARKQLEKFGFMSSWVKDIKYDFQNKKIVIVQ